MPIAPPPAGFHGPVKRSVTIAGHQTSISLEPAFWRALEEQAAARALPLNALIAEIDALRIAAPVPPNLASALRSWLFGQANRDMAVSIGENNSQ
ncbi:MAG: ribbon-helix-helix domain-containing protein [Pseudomonadota bacterium]|nr:ribbon-helix-helix domain-containing protein [Pseudomonadota bacterium]